MREKLINLLSTAGWNLFTSEHSKQEIADHLIKNGVTIHDANSKEETHGHWIIRSTGRGKYATNWAECSECHVCGSPVWKRCPVCEAIMDLPNITDQTMDALKKMGEKVHGNDG